MQTAVALPATAAIAKQGPLNAKSNLNPKKNGVFDLSYIMIRLGIVILSLLVLVGIVLVTVSVFNTDMKNDHIAPFGLDCAVYRRTRSIAGSTDFEIKKINVKKTSVQSSL